MVRSNSNILPSVIPMSYPWLDLFLHNSNTSIFCSAPGKCQPFSQAPSPFPAPSMWVTAVSELGALIRPWAGCQQNSPGPGGEKKGASLVRDRNSWRVKSCPTINPKTSSDLAGSWLAVGKTNLGWHSWKLYFEDCFGWHVFPLCPCCPGAVGVDDAHVKQQVTALATLRALLQRILRSVDLCRKVTSVIRSSSSSLAQGQYISWI